MVQFTKKELRKKMLGVLNEFIILENSASNLINNLSEFFCSLNKEKLIVAGYYPTKTEPNILSFLARLSEKKCYITLPVINDSMEIDFCLWKTSDQVTPSKHAAKIMEPLDKTIILNPDVILVPLIACDNFGNRIGSGMGMYDKKISQLRLLNKDLKYVGICYDFQVLEEVETEEHDQKLDAIITEKKLIVC